ncbi:hypothetical protein MRX96_048027 [Rhipicephalus microplus]
MAALATRTHQWETHRRDSQGSGLRPSCLALTPRLVRGRVSQQASKQACLVLEEACVVRWHLERRVVRLGLLRYFVGFVGNHRGLVYGCEGRRGGGRRHRGPRKNNRGRPGIEQRR